MKSTLISTIHADIQLLGVLFKPIYGFVLPATLPKSLLIINMLKKSEMDLHNYTTSKLFRVKYFWSKKNIIHQSLGPEYFVKTFSIS